MRRSASALMVFVLAVLIASCDGPQNPLSPDGLEPRTICGSEGEGDCQLGPVGEPVPTSPPKTPETICEGDYCGGSVGPGDSGGDPGAGSGTPPPPNSPPPPDTACNTTDEVLNSPEVQAGMQNLWAFSNPNGAMQDRQERGGWIVQTASGYTVDPFPLDWTIGPCGINVPVGTMPPAGAVAWLHTHPYGNGEMLTSCEGTRIEIGGQVFTAYVRYTNDPSEPDGKTATLWNLRGYVIDKDKITEFIGDPNSPQKYQISERADRCGY
jgi:hypothetical protein